MGASTISIIIVAVVVVAAVVAFVVVQVRRPPGAGPARQATAIRAKALALDRRLREDEADRLPAEAESRSEGHDQRRTGTA